MTRPRITKNVSRRVRAVLACGVLLGTGAIGTTALWSTSAATVSGEFTTTELEITANGTKTVPFNFSGPVYPGYTTTPVVIAVTNAGSRTFKYNVSVSSGQAVGRAMRLTLGGTSCTGAGTVTDEVISSTPTVVSPGRGALAAGATESLCIRLTMPATGVLQSGVAGQSGTVLLTFDAVSA